jgi:hypothetical protein
LALPKNKKSLVNTKQLLAERLDGGVGNFFID